MESWNWGGLFSDYGLFLDEGCAVNGPAISGAADARIISNIRNGYFEGTYKGKQFSDTGVMKKYARRFDLIGQGRPYAQMEKDGDGVFCMMDADRQASMETRIPVESPVRMSGTIADWAGDQTLGLDECSVTRSGTPLAARRLTNQPR